MPNLDHPDLQADRDAFERRLAELGPDTVRAMVAGGQFPTGHSIVITEWLGAQQKEKR